MSWLSSAINWLTHLGATSSDPAVQSTASTLGAAVTAAKNAVPTAAAAALNEVLGMVPGGTVVEGLADEVVEGLIGALLGLHSNPTAALATVAANQNTPQPAAAAA